MPAPPAILKIAEFRLPPRPEPERVATGVTEIDALTGGLPRGSLTEIYGAATSGRTSLLLSIMAQATAREEFCALIDTGDAFDPQSAAAAGVALDRLLWVRCGGNAEHALKAADLLVHSGGFGLIVMDLGDTPPHTAARISLTSWFRLRRGVEHTPTALVIIERQPNAKSSASLAIQMRRAEVRWRGKLFRSAKYGATLLRPAGQAVCFTMDR